MPLVTINVIENVFTDEQKLEMIDKVTDAMVSIEGEAMRGITWVLIEEVREGHWGIGGEGIVRPGSRNKITDGVHPTSAGCCELREQYERRSS